MMVQPNLRRLTWAAVFILLLVSWFVVRIIRRYSQDFDSTRLEYVVDAVFQSSDDYDYAVGSNRDGRRQAKDLGRSRAEFCLDALPQAPRQPIGNSSIASSSFTKIAATSKDPIAANVQLDRIAESIRSKYVELFRATQLNVLTATNDEIGGASSKGTSSGSCWPRVLEYSCAGKRGYRCGGLGDRLRGLVTVFYMALLTNSVFVSNWQYPTELEAYFEPVLIQRELVDETLFYDREAGKRRKPKRYLLRFIDKNDIDAAYILGDIPHVLYLFDTYDIISLEINSLLPLEVLLSHPYYRSMVDYYQITNLSYAQLYSVALRIIFKKETLLLRSAVGEILPSIMSTEHDGRIGIQVRLGLSEWGEDDRVDNSKLACFVQKFVNVSREAGYTRPLVFVTADSENAITYLRDRIESLPGRNTFFTLPLNSYPITHVDRTKFAYAEPEAVRAGLRTFVDWIILAHHMDQLVISRSGFGESASQLRMTPATRLVHNETGCHFADYKLESVHLESSTANQQFYPSFFVLFLNLSALIFASILCRHSYLLNLTHSSKL